MTIPTHPSHLSSKPAVTPKLLQPTRLKGLEVRNRAVMSPMCMYSAQDGLANDFHLAHYGSMALGGVGLILLEATAVSPEGRISPADLGLWADEHIAPLGHITDFAHKYGAQIGVQLAHAGRKASTYRPSDGHGALSLERGGWQVYGPSDLPYNESYPQPQAMTPDDIANLPGMFAAAARRAETAGFDVVEVHAAHGYLLHQFLSPLSNTRTDDYGGSFENRIRLPLEVIRAVRHAWPEHMPMLVRLSATDWVEGGWDIEQTCQLAKILRNEGVTLLDISSGGLDPRQQIPVEPLYQVPLAHQVKQAAPELDVMAVGLIETPMQAEQILQEGMADWVALGRALLRDPHWPQRAAREFGIEPALPDPYARAGW